MPTVQWPSTTMHLTGNFSRPSGESPWWLRCWSVSTPGKNIGPCLHGSQLPTWSTRLIMGLLGNTGWVFSSRTRGMPSTLIPTAPHFWSLSTKSMCYRDRWYSIRMLQGSFSRSCGLYAFSFLATRSPELPLGAITDVFREYDFAYNDAKIRRLLWCHMHTCWPLPLPLPSCSLMCSYLLS